VAIHFWKVYARQDLATRDACLSPVTQRHTYALSIACLC
jgi:hypothetical protein